MSVKAIASVALLAAVAGPAAPPPNMVLADIAVIETPPPPPPCSEVSYGREPRTERSDYRSHPTGAWSVYGYRVRSGYFSVSMTDTNLEEKGSMFVRLVRDSDGARISVRSFGSSGIEEELDDAKWKSASTSERARIAKGTMMRLARQAATACDGRISSLSKELATFDKAFAEFNRYR